MFGGIIKDEVGAAAVTPCETEDEIVLCSKTQSHVRLCFASDGGPVSGPGACLGWFVEVIVVKSEMSEK